MTRLSAYVLVTASVPFDGVGTVTVPVNVGEASGAFASRAVCSPDVLAMESAASAMAVAFQTDVTTPVKFAFVASLPLSF